MNLGDSGVEFGFGDEGVVKGDSDAHRDWGSGSSGTENALQPDPAAAPVPKPTCDYRNNMTCEAASS